MASISSDLHRRIRKALLDCGPLQDDNELRAIFADPDLSPWRHSVPQASDPAARADAVMAYLVNKRRSDTNENALVLLLRVLSERLDPGDECHHRLSNLADKLENPLEGLVVYQDLSNSKTSTSGFYYSDETSSLERQLAKLKQNLLTIEEQKADFIDPRTIPPDLVKSEKLIRERIAEIEARLAELKS